MMYDHNRPECDPSLSAYGDMNFYPVNFGQVNYGPVTDGMRCIIRAHRATAQVGSKMSFWIF